MRIAYDKSWTRTHRCGELRSEDTGQEVVLNGWIHRRRDLGGLIFLDLRDRSGIVQIVCDPQINEPAVELSGHVARAMSIPRCRRVR